MGGDGQNDDGPGGLPSQDCKTDFSDDGTEGHTREMVVVLGGCGSVYYKALDDNGLPVEAEGNDCGVCCMETNLQTV